MLSGPVLFLALKAAGRRAGFPDSPPESPGISRVFLRFAGFSWSAKRAGDREHTEGRGKRPGLRGVEVQAGMGVRLQHTFAITSSYYHTGFRRIAAFR